MIETDDIWEYLYMTAGQTIRPLRLSDTVYIGETASAIVADISTIFVGVSVEAGSGLGICSERNVIMTALSYGYKIKKLVTVNLSGEILRPCGACLEFIQQLGEMSKGLEILLDNDGHTLRIK